jgi:transposase
MTQLSARPSTLSKASRPARVKRGRTKAARPLSLKNRQTLKLLQNWMRTPTDRTTNWWLDFERELADDRLAFRST